MKELGKYNIEYCIDATRSYQITCEVDYYSAGRSAYTSGLPEDCYRAEDAEVNYNITKVITFIDHDGYEESLVSIGNSLDIPEKVNEMELTGMVLKAHEQKLIDDADCKADYLYEEGRMRR